MARSGRNLLGFNQSFKGDEVEAVFFRFRRPAFQHIHRGGVGVADGDGRAFVARYAFGFGELGADGVGGLVIVIEEDVAADGGQAFFDGDFFADGLGAGAGVEEEEVALLEFVHHHSHAFGIGGVFAAHMVVDAVEAGKAGEGGFETHLLVARGEIDEESAGAGVFVADRFHRHVEEEFVAIVACLFGLFAQAHGVGEERKRDGRGEIDGAFAAFEIDADIVDDDGDFGTRAGGERFLFFGDDGDGGGFGRRRWKGRFFAGGDGWGFGLRFGQRRGCRRLLDLDGYAARLRQMGGAGVRVQPQAASQENQPEEDFEFGSARAFFHWRNV